MRTTVTIDPDVEKLLRRAMRELGEPFKQVLNDAVREGLHVISGRRTLEKPYRQPVFAMGEPQIDLTKASALAGELEDQDIIAKMRLGK